MGSGVKVGSATKAVVGSGEGVGSGVGSGLVVVNEVEVVVGSEGGGLKVAGSDSTTKMGSVVISASEDVAGMGVGS